MSSPVLRLQGITKHFGALTANDGISLQLARGEVLALLGENGAGKSTLMSVLFGHYVADAGTIEVNGRRLPPGQPRAALAAGIGMVHQHFTLADNLSVLDNVMLGREPLWRLRSRRGEALARLLDLARRFGLSVDPAARVGSLSVGERQRVEILKALSAGAASRAGSGPGTQVLILDEPTAVLTPQETDSLFATLRQMVAEGVALIFISHKLDEVLRIADRVAVLRGGRLVAELPAAGADTALLAEAMVGRAVAQAVRRGHVRGDLVCTLPGTPLALHAGEILAIAGVAGNGQAALAERLCGLAPESAPPMMLGGQPLRARPRDFVAAGVARIPEDRHAVGLIGDLPLWENAVLERYATPRFARAGVIRRGAARAQAQAIVERFDVRGGGLDRPVRALSGGNMQKLILGRALIDANARLIVADQPTWGLDVGAVAEVHQRLLDAATGGAAVLLISEDLDEIFALADRIAVIHDGELGEPKPAAQWTLAGIGLAMAGSRSGSA